MNKNRKIQYFHVYKIENNFVMPNQADFRELEDSYC
jgi:hypothetical protein